MRVVRFGLRATFVYFLVAAKEVESFAPSGSRTSCYLLSQHHISTLQKGGQPTNNFNGDMQYTHPSSDYRGIFNNNAYSSNRCTTSLKMSTSPAVATTSTIVSVLQSLHGNNSFVLSALLVLAGIGIAMEQKTTFGKALSVSSLWTIFLLVLSSNIMYSTATHLFLQGQSSYNVICTVSG